MTLVTTLLDAALYPLVELAKLSGSRWRVELNLPHLKTTMRMDVSKCATVDGVLKELTVYAIVHNCVRLVMLEASRNQAVEVERISFADALRWLTGTQPVGDLARLAVNPERPGRFEPRVRKRRPKQYTLMKRPRTELCNYLLMRGVVAYLRGYPERICKLIRDFRWDRLQSVKP